MRLTEFRAIGEYSTTFRFGQSFSSAQNNKKDGNILEFI